MVYIQPQVLSQIMPKHCQEIIIHNKPVSNPVIFASKTDVRIPTLPFEEIHGITLGFNVCGRKRRGGGGEKKTLRMYQWGCHGNVRRPYFEVELGEECFCQPNAWKENGCNHFVE